MMKILKMVFKKENTEKYKEIAVFLFIREIKIKLGYSLGFVDY